MQGNSESKLAAYGTEPLELWGFEKHTKNLKKRLKGLSAKAKNRGKRSTKNLPK